MSAVATREEILTHIGVLLSNISGVVTFARNSILQEDAALPAIILLDGREDLFQRIVEYKTVFMPPALMRMQPQICVAIKQRENKNNDTLNGVYAPIGAEINAWRDIIVGTLNSDPTLMEMLTANGQMVFRGMETDMENGREVKGEAIIKIDFYYVWEPPS